jgi:Response regulator of the LytR/AlgR family
MSNRDDKTVRYVILEDEYYTSLNLKSMISELRPNYRLIAESGSVIGATELLMNSEIDLIFSEVKLSDELSFKLFESLNIPILFISGYGEYASQAVSYNCVDYILKPISEEQLHKAIRRFEVISGLDNAHSNEACLLQKDSDNSSYFFAEAGNRVVAVKKEDVAYIDKSTAGAYLHLLSGEVLKYLSSNGNPASFGIYHGFVNMFPHYVVNMNSVESVRQLLGWRKKLVFKSKAKVELKVPLYINRKSFY